MSAEILREAAKLMRERAELATPGDPRNPGGGYEAYVLGSEGYAVMGAPREGRRITRTFVARCGMNDWDTDKANAEHIASWHPAVALAVADWLDSQADLWGHPGFVDSVFDVHPATAVAHAYLGESS